jgi:stearoyl-CoA desaturase (delta-9 desaturase)
MHHAYSDTEKDPHTPHFFKDVYTMMMHTKKIYNDVLNKRVVIEEKFDRNFPEYPAIDKVADSWFTRIGFGVLYFVVYLLVFIYVPGYHWTIFLLLPIHFLMGPIQGAIVNWAGHKYGYRNFEEDDKSKNTLFWDFLLMGELFQNNHHHAGAKPNFAAKWYEFDPTYPIILFLDKIKVIKLVRVKK